MSSPRRRGRRADARPPGPRVGPDTVVTITYRLFDARGALCDELPVSRPLRYVHGYGQVIPGLEGGLEGCRAGDLRTLRLQPGEAFGERVEGAVLRLDRRALPGAAPVQVGDELMAEAPDGSECTYRVVELSEEQIVADLNHPLAGQRVRFEVQVLSVRPAREGEIAAAQDDAHERIVRQGAIVYSCGPGGSDVAVARPWDGAAGGAPARRGNKPPPSKGAT